MRDGLAPGIRSRTARNINGLDVYFLEAGFEGAGRPCVLLLHGFPELAYSWRHVMMPLAQAGFHVVAPDQRGYGRTTGWDGDYDGDLASFRLFNLVRDALGLVAALGYRSVASVVGHDFGSPVAAYCSLLRPDVFRSVVLMSAPFAGPPALAFDSLAKGPTARVSLETVNADLGALDPPRRHYISYFATREANANMLQAPQGLRDFLRAYYHAKSADWPGNKVFKLGAFSAAALASLPSYYVMDSTKGMAESMAPYMPSADEIARCAWLSDDELGVYCEAFARTGFQGALQWYRCATGKFAAELEVFSGRTIDVPSCFIAGASDWGVYQMPGAFERMQSSACRNMEGCHLIEGAGHWVQQERAADVNRLLIDFLGRRV